MLGMGSEKRNQVEKRMQAERVVWLTTVKEDGTPQPTPVWFILDGETVLIYTLKNSRKLRNIAKNHKAALNFNSDVYGDNVLVMTGDILVDTQTPPADQNDAYLKKYREDITGLQMTPQSFAEDYAVPLRFYPLRVRA